MGLYKTRPRQMYLNTMKLTMKTHKFISEVQMKDWYIETPALSLIIIIFPRCHVLNVTLKAGVCRFMSCLEVLFFTIFINNNQQSIILIYNLISFLEKYNALTNRRIMEY